MRTCESRCLFSGSKGEVCCVEPLHAGLELKDHPISQYSLLAMASLTKVHSYIQYLLLLTTHSLNSRGVTISMFLFRPIIYNIHNLLLGSNMGFIV